jgi:2Fe-2S iron-sulfur cluster protein
MAPEQQARWVQSFVAHGASQCGFCTPGIIMRLASLEGQATPTRDSVEAALRAHLCRCTGWQSIVEAAADVLGFDAPGGQPVGAPRDPFLASWRAQLEGATFQSSGPATVLGDAGFADDTAPAYAIVQLGSGAEPAPSQRAARSGAGRVQGRNSTVALAHPVAVPDGAWDLTLQTTWVEPAYLEPDASWCLPDGDAATPLANGGAFGGKAYSPVPSQAQVLARATGTAARVVWRREDTVRLGPKRPPLALGVRADGTGVVRIARSPASSDLGPLVESIAAVAPGVGVEFVEVAGPPVAADLRGAGWAEVLAALAACRADPTTAGRGHADVSIGASRATADIDLSDGERGTVRVEVWAGELLDPVTVRSYVLGSVHQALGLVWSEGIAVDEAGTPLDLTIRSFGILPARAMPDVIVTLHDGDAWPVNGSDAVFVATLAAAHLAEGAPPQWPTRRSGGRAHEWPVAPSSEFTREESS